ncbi:MAG TPA: FG-GAP repeat protein [Acidimicrobiia bacterium]|jgi:hypothetical protein
MRAPFVAIAVATLVTPLGAGIASATRAPNAPAQHARAHTVAVRSATLAVAARHHPDFNGDGYADLIAEVPNDNVGSAQGAGAIWAIYGGAHGANTSNRHTLITESSVAHGATSNDADNFGWVTAWGDFNHDGYDDLAIGAPGTTVDGQSSAGEVVVLYGSAHGLGSTNAQVFTEATTGLGATPQLNDYFGLGLAAGDFNHDGDTDLAIDAGGVGVHGVTRSGRVYELFGTRGGLSHASPLLPQHFDESTPGIHGGLVQNDDWGRTLAAGDFNGDGYADLAVGAPKKAVGSEGGAGVVDVLYGGHGGLSAKGAQTWTENTAGVPANSEPADAWGWSLAAFDINGDHRSDLVVGAPTKTVTALSSAGTLTMLYGSAHGLNASVSPQQVYVLSNITNSQSPAADDELGVSLAAFDFDGDHRPDLAIGVSGRHILGRANAGEVVVLHNVGGRLSRTGGFVIDRTFSNDVPGANQNFGLVLTPGDFSGNGAADLGVSLPGLTVDTETGAGAMQVFYGSAHGFSRATQQLWDAPALGGTAVQDAAFGGLNNPAGA